MSYHYGHNFKANEKGVMYVSRPEERNILVGKNWKGNNNWKT